MPCLPCLFHRPGQYKLGAARDDSWPGFLGYSTANASRSISPFYNLTSCHQKWTLSFALPPGTGPGTSWVLHFWWLNKWGFGVCKGRQSTCSCYRPWCQPSLAELTVDLMVSWGHPILGTMGLWVACGRKGRKGWLRDRPWFLQLEVFCFNRNEALFWPLHLSGVKTMFIS